MSFEEPSPLSPIPSDFSMTFYGRGALNTMVILWNHKIRETPESDLFNTQQLIQKTTTDPEDTKLYQVHL